MNSELSKSDLLRGEQRLTRGQKSITKCHLLSNLPEKWGDMIRVFVRTRTLCRRATLPCWLFGLAMATLAFMPASGRVHWGFQRQSINSGRWRLSIATDRFTGEMQCRLRTRDHSAIYRAGGVGLLLGRHVDITAARLRIDGGQTVIWRNLLPELARLRVPIDGRDVSVPIDGIVWVPADMIANAHLIWIERTPGAQPRRFRVEGLSPLLLKVRQVGCDIGTGPSQ